MVTQQQTSTPMQEWVAQALDRMQPILDGKVVVGILAEDWHQEAMTAIMEDVEWLVQHFKVLPEPCNGDENGENQCPGWYAGYNIGMRVGGLATMEELRRRLDD